MAFQVSPGVQVTEKDLTNVVPAVATSIAGIVMAAEKGPTDTIPQLHLRKSWFPFLVNHSQTVIILKIGWLLRLF